MKAFLEYVLKNLVDAPEAVSVHQSLRSGKTVYDIRVRPGDVGKVVGKQGQTIAAIRGIMSAAAERYGERVDVEILEDNLAESAPLSKGASGDGGEATGASAPGSSSGGDEN